jgi:hypothetical protein
MDSLPSRMEVIEAYNEIRIDLRVITKKLEERKKISLDESFNAGIDYSIIRIKNIIDAYT